MSASSGTIMNVAKVLLELGNRRTPPTTPVVAPTQPTQPRPTIRVINCCSMCATAQLPTATSCSVCNWNGICQLNPLVHIPCIWCKQGTPTTMALIKKATNAMERPMFMALCSGCKHPRYLRDYYLQQVGRRNLQLCLANWKKYRYCHVCYTAYPHGLDPAPQHAKCPACQVALHLMFDPATLLLCGGCHKFTRSSFGCVSQGTCAPPTTAIICAECTRWRTPSPTEVSDELPTLNNVRARAVRQVRAKAPGLKKTIQKKAVAEDNSHMVWIRSRREAYARMQMKIEADKKEKEAIAAVVARQQAK